MTGKDFDYEEFCRAADEIVDKLPEKLKKGVAVFGEQHEHECQAFTDGRERGKDLIFGYFHDFYGQKRIVLCYWAFKAFAHEQDGDYDWRRHLEEVIAHEFVHHVESDRTYQPLAEQEKRQDRE